MKGKKAVEIRPNFQSYIIPKIIEKIIPPTALITEPNIDKTNALIFVVSIDNFVNKLPGEL